MAKKKKHLRTSLDGTKKKLSGSINWSDLENGLIPAIIQDADTRNVLMLGYMNTEALEKTKKTGKVTFYSRSKKRLWTKGETSGNTLKMVDMTFDCDRDTLLVKARPRGPVCHTGNETCWTEKNSMGLEFMHRLESVIRKRKKQSSRKSYTARLFEKGADQIVKKFGEEAVEVIIDAKNKDNKAFLEECADMMYHFLVLLNMKECGFEDVVNVLETRHKA